MITCKISITAGQLWKQELCPPPCFPSQLSATHCLPEAPPPQLVSVGELNQPKPVTNQSTSGGCDRFLLPSLTPCSGCTPHVVPQVHPAECCTCCKAGPLQMAKSNGNKNNSGEKINHMPICRTQSYTAQAVAKKERNLVKNMNLYKCAWLKKNNPYS